FLRSLVEEYCLMGIQPAQELTETGHVRAGRLGDTVAVYAPFDCEIVLNADFSACRIAAFQLGRKLRFVPEIVFDGGKTVLAGNKALMLDENISVPDDDIPGATMIYVAADGCYMGLISAKDSIKADSASAIEGLKKLGISCVMLTGDSEGSAREICRQAGIESWKANVLPGDKAAVVESLRSSETKVLMVGDGINDAPALAAADVGIAIGSGTDVAIESADIVLMGGELTSLYDAVRLSKAVMRIIKQNLFWAFFYNCCGIPLAAGLIFALGGPLLPPMFAGAAMALSSISVVSNALRLKRFK
ncbi:MAG: HAD-IC family P-type ATPase, partial [Oscillospiraceae bacterium]|nr:HAD-IC family P-type ATPase [Oscillospiraceae bacterium]